MVTFDWRYALLRNWPFIVFMVAILFADLLLDNGWLQLIAPPIIFIGFWIPYYLVFLKAHCRQHPQDDPKNRTTKPATVAVIAAVVFGGILLWLVPDRFSDVVTVGALWFGMVISDGLSKPKRQQITS